jgi:glutamate dehydrogenase (NAD(P)+)
MTLGSIIDKAQFEKKLLELSSKFEVLKPELEYTVRDAEFGVEGFVVVWSTKAASHGALKGVGKGGTRITPTVCLEEIGMLARVMTLKNAAAGLPLGGAKSGLKADPKSPDFEKKYKKFVSLCRPILAEHGGPFGGFGFDIGGDPIQAIWACDELKSNRSFTGKPLHLGGTDYDREGIAGLGVVEAAKAYKELTVGTLKGARCAVQGLGAMGGAVVRYLIEEGAQLVAISDPRIGGTLRQEDVGSDATWNEILHYAASLDVVSAQRSIPKNTTINPDSSAVLFESCDIIFPCAVQNVVTEQNQAAIRASLVVEGANGPCSEGARAALFNRGVVVIPDFIANPGGIIAAYVELTSSVSVDENVKNRTKVHEAKKMTKEKISQNIKELYTLYKSINVDFVAGGKFLAYARIFGGV